MNTMSSPKKVDLKSVDIAAQKRDALKQSLKKVLPEVFNEDKVDFVQLQSALGELVAEPNERFGLVWAGKSDCAQITRERSVATLLPVREESVDFDNTGNLFIEGDNLEVLKLLQRSYFGKVKMIYIDPPYNTGKEFIYPDKYSETLDTYLKYTGQKDGNGRILMNNAETSGRYHSRWLNMMYPRLSIAKSLLRDDGVIFISIGGNEQANLKALCDLTFGEENFVGLITRESKKGANRGTHLSPAVDYVVVYAKSIDFLGKFYLPLDDDYINSFDRNDNDGRGAYKLNNLYEPTLEYFENCRYPINCPDGEVVITPENKSFSHNKESFEELLASGQIVFCKARSSQLIKTDGGETKWSVRRKIFLNDMVKKGRRPSDLLLDKINANGTKCLTALDIPFEFSKPIELIVYLAQIVNDKDAVVLDFFAGSGTTPHAIMQLNSEDNGKRSWIAVQLPEKTNVKSRAHNAGYSNIAEISRERIRRAAKKIADEKNQIDLDDNGGLDLGFKAFKLAQSNFKVWESDSEKITDLGQQLEEHIDHIAADATPEDILYELMLKTGYSLTAPVEKITLAGKEVFAIDDGDLLICLEKEITQEVIDAIANKNPSRVICLDESFGGNDQLKTNAVHTFKIRAEHEGTEIVFRTV